MKQLTILITGLVLMAGTVAYADEVNDLIRQGQTAYDAGDYPEAVALFQQVVEQVQSRMAGVIGTFFPKPMSGWSAGEIENSSWSGSSDGASHSMINSSRTYTRDSDGAEVNLQFCNWPTVVQSMKAGTAAYANPMLADMLKQQGIEFKSEERNGWQILTVINRQSSEAQIMAFSNNIMIMVQSTSALAAATQGYFEMIPLADMNSAMQ